MAALFEYRHTVTKDEIDELGHAGNVHYVKWMQWAAIAHSTDNGWSAEKYRSLGSGWVVRSHAITYHRAAFEGDSVIVRTWVRDMKPATSLRHYEMRNQKGELLATAETDWAFVNYSKQKPTRVPKEVASSFEVLARDPQASPAPG